MLWIWLKRVYAISWAPITKRNQVLVSTVNLYFKINSNNVTLAFSIGVQFFSYRKRTSERDTASHVQK